MEVNVTLKYSFQRKHLKDKEYSKVTLKEGATVQDLINILEVRKYYLKKVTANGEEKDICDFLSDGDNIVIWPLRLGGG